MNTKKTWKRCLSLCMLGHNLSLTSVFIGVLRPPFPVTKHHSFQLTGLRLWRIGCVRNDEQSEWINLHHHVLHTCNERDKEQDKHLFARPPPPPPVRFSWLMLTTVVEGLLSFFISYTLFFSPLWPAAISLPLFFFIRFFSFSSHFFVLSSSSPFTSLYPFLSLFVAALHHLLSLWALNGCWLIPLCSRWSISPLFSSTQGTGVPQQAALTRARASPH